MNETIISTQRDRRITNFIDSLPRGRNFSIKIMRTLRKGGLTWDPWILKDDQTYRLFYLDISSFLSCWTKSNRSAQSLVDGICNLWCNVY